MLDQKLLKKVMEVVYEKGQSDNLTLYELMDELVGMLEPFIDGKNRASIGYRMDRAH